MRVALCQTNSTVGDLPGNMERIRRAAYEASDNGAHLAVFPELVLTGYPPLDLLERPTFIEDARRACAQLVDALPEGLTVVFGTVRRRPTPPVVGRALQNIAVIAQRGSVLGTVVKSLLPTYDVFHEARYFSPAGAPSPVFEVAGRRVGVTICEDIWNDDEMWQNDDLWRDKAPGSHRIYDRDPLAELVRQHAPDIVVNLSASPWSWGKEQARRRLLKHVARRHRIWMLYANLVGANDGLIFDGNSMAYDPAGVHVGTGPSWTEGSLLVDLEASSMRIEPTRDESREIRAALSLGIRDYLEKSGIPRAIIGLSGGIDSAVTATLAVHALGSERVLGVAMPSRVSSEGSVADAAALAGNLGIQMHQVPIEPINQAFLEGLGPLFGDRPTDVTEENLQSRIRGVILMAVSNKFGGVVLNTGNKSEAAVGYATIYGDAIGALSVLGDLYKHQVYQQAELANEDEEVIPRSTIRKPPSAELRPDQRDEDSLPPYDVLDPMLRMFLEARATPEEIATALSLAPKEVDQVVRLVYQAEYKRKQFPPTLRVSRKAWVGRLFPIVNRFRR